MRKTTILIFVLFAGSILLTSCGMETQKDSAINPTPPAPPAIQPVTQPIPAPSAVQPVVQPVPAQPAAAASDSTLIQEKLDSFNKRADDQKWVINVVLTCISFVITLMAAFIALIAIKSGREYKEAVDKAEKSADRAHELEREAQRKCDTIDERINAKIAEFDNKANNKFNEIDNKIEKLGDKVAERVIRESQKQREISEKWSKALIALQDKKYELADKLWSEVVQENPTDYGALNNRGNALQGLADLGGPEAKKHLQDACTNYGKATELKPDFHVPFHNWGNSLKRLALLSGPEAEKCYQEACIKYQRSTELNPNFYDSFNSWGTALLNWSRLKNAEEKEALYREAERVLLKAEEIKKGSGAYNLACLFTLRKNEDKCQEWLKVGEEAKTLLTREYAIEDDDLTSVREKPWFKAIRWKGE